ncbi:MAG: BTAD domain-containing putative transcriptional regulator [Alphaproteobacteria bacterium]
MIFNMAGLKLSLFGGFAACLSSGQSISLSRRKAKALLAYLALHQGRPQSREKIAGLLWGDRDEAHARASLRQVLMILRRSLPRRCLNAATLSGEELLVARGGVAVDVIDFRKAIAEGTMAAFERAADLYCGELLEGFDLDEEEFRDWLVAERADLQRLAVDVLRRLLTWDATRGAIDAAERTAHQLLAIDPLQEDVQRHLMHLYVQQGRRDQALRQYARCHDILQAELGVVPAPETERLYRVVRDNLWDHTSPAAPLRFSLADSGPPDHNVAVLRVGSPADASDLTLFADALTQEVVANLSAWHTFSVLDRGTGFAYGQPAADVGAPRRNLAARYMLAGVVSESGGRIRVAARLTDEETERLVWTDKFYHVGLDNLAALDDISRRIAATVASEVEMALSNSVIEQDRTQLDAWHLCQLGTAAKRQRTKSGACNAIRIFEQAIASEPRHAQALSGLAGSLILAGSQGWTASRPQSVTRAVAATEEAVARDPTDPSIRVTRGLALLHARAFERGRAELLTALELNPSNAFAYAFLGCANEYMGEAEQGIESLRMALRLAPKRDPMADPFSTWLARAYLSAGLYEDAAGLAQRAIERRPDYGETYVVLASSLHHLGRGSANSELLDQCERLNPGFLAQRLEYQYYIDHRGEDHVLAGLHAWH